MDVPPKFAHGYDYGDYSGVNFYGPPQERGSRDLLAVSDAYFIPLCNALLVKCSKLGVELPSVVRDWNECTGLFDSSPSPNRLNCTVATEFAAALAQLTTDEIAPECAGCTAQECLECANLICDFINERLEQHRDLYVDQD